MKKIKRKLNKNARKALLTGTIIIIVAIGGYLLFGNKQSQMDSKEKGNIKEEVPEKKNLKIIDLDSRTRNIAVMINNISNVWGYQSGLQEAYLVYEAIVEGGYTRLMALYKDQNLERIGSVRSARPYYLDYVLENDALYVHFGGSDQALAEINQLGIQNINFLTSAGYWRDTSLKLATEHTAYTSTSNIEAQLAKKKYRTATDENPLLKYTAEEVDLSTMENSQPANKVNISYSNVKSTSFEYDKDSKVYKRFQNEKPHTDYISKEQYTAKNIITYQVENYSLDSYGRQALKNIGTGTGYYISNGYAVEITWQKESRSDKTVYKYLDGTEIEVNDGNTYIEIQPKNKNLSFE